MKKINYSGLKATILTLSFIQMATNAISGILADISAAFPGTSASTIQYLMTFPNLLVMVMSIITAQISRKIPKRTIAILGSAGCILAGVGSFSIHNSLPLMFVWAGLLGLGTGLVVPVAQSTISDYFEGSEKDRLLGWQTSAANVGSMMMTFLGGLVAMLSWHYTYLVYLLAVPGLICAILFIPKGIAVSENESEGSSSRIPGFAWKYIFTAAIFMMVNFMGSMNLSMLVEERSIGNAVTAGTGAAIMLLGGSLVGMIFGSVAGKIGKMTVSAGCLLLSAGYLLAYFARNTLTLYLACFMFGSSSAFILPQCMGSVATKDKSQTTFLMAVVLAITNLSIFLSPFLTSLSAVVMGKDAASTRFLFASILAGAMLIISPIVVRSMQKD